MNTKPIPDDRAPLAMSVPEAVMASGLSRTSLYEAIKAGDLIAKKFGSRTVILREDLLRFLNNLASA